MSRQLHKGFTVVELLVAISVASIIAIGTVGLYVAVTSQMPMINARNTLSTNLQNTLNRINDDVRLSSNASLYNMSPDANAPTTKSGYTDVPGPDTDTDDRYFWRMSFNRLLLNQTPVDASGNAIYDNADYAAGKRNTIVYYVRDGALYRRMVAADYPNNSISTTTCTRVAAGGCTSSDIKVIDGLDPSLGDNAFVVTYYDKNGSEIKNTKFDGSGNSIPDYTGFPLTRSVGIKISLKSGAVIGTQTVSQSNTMRMQFRSQQNIVPPPVVNPPVVPPTNNIGDPGLMAGPGGLKLSATTFMGVSLLGTDFYIKGKVSLDMNSGIGSSTQPANLNVANIACGSGASYPQLCSDAPITSHFTSNIYGNVCATSQPTSSFIHPAGTMNKGLITGCVSPSVDLPILDKAAFTASMTSTSAGSSVNCFGGSALVASRKYTGDVNTGYGCTLTVNGNAYITGNFYTSAIKVSESAGKVRPVIVVNGQVALTGTTIQPNSYGTAPYIVSFKSSYSTCSNDPSCTTLTPQQLQDSLGMFYSGGSAPISLLGVNAPGTAFYSYFGEMYTSLSTVGAAAGQRVFLANSLNGMALNASLSGAF